MEKVYGAATAQTVDSWHPKAFEEGKSRYLWTDAFGVCNYLTLYKETSDELYLRQAVALVNAVHGSLGFERDGKKRLGNASADRPCVGGLRIGKPKAEGGGMSDDGQYFHYLTKWMFALNRMFLVTKEAKYRDWSVDLAEAAHRSFVRNGRMFWKMSIDLSHPLVNSEGGLDSYDGLAMYKIIQQSSGSDKTLQNEIHDMQQLVNTRYPRYRTNDTLDAGEALWLSSWFPQESWAKALKSKAAEAVEKLWQSKEFEGKPAYRLAFREFGTTTGVQLHADMSDKWKPRVALLHEFWEKHLFDRDADITPVMFCSSLLPGVLRKDYLS